MVGFSRIIPHMKALRSLGFVGASWVLSLNCGTASAGNRTTLRIWAMGREGDLLAKAGYREFPQTWAEWTSAMKKIKSQMSDRQFPLLMPTNEWAQPVILALQEGSPILRDGGRYGAFGQPQFRSAFDFYVGIFRQGLVSPVSRPQALNLLQEFHRWA